MPDTPSEPLIHLNENVWYFRRDTSPDVVQPNIGVIRTKNSTILIDAGNSPRHARRIMTELAAEGFPSVRTIIYTHHHPDHVFGAMGYNAERVIAHQMCDEMLREDSEKSWTQNALQDEMRQKPEMQGRNSGILHAIQHWRDFFIVKPTLNFNASLTLYVDDETTLHLAHVGGVHAEDSIVVTAQEAGVMFVGDSYYPPPMHLRTPENADDLALEMLRDFVAKDAIIYLDGHGDPRSHDEMQTLIDTEAARQAQSK